MNELINQYHDGNALSASGSAARPIEDRLRALISEGGYAPGSRLPPERELINALGVGRTALRKALDTLEREGTIWRHVGKGTFISQDGPASESGGLMSVARQLTPFRAMRARIVIEPALAREAALNASAEAQTRMRLAMERAAAAATWEEYEAQDDRFHRAIAEGADNVLLLAVFDQLNAVRRKVAWGAVTRDTVRPPEGHTSFAEHAALAEAIARRDPDAAYETMRAHLRSVSERLFAGEQ